MQLHGNNLREFWTEDNDDELSDLDLVNSDLLDSVDKRNVVHKLKFKNGKFDVKTKASMERERDKEEMDIDTNMNTEYSFFNPFPSTWKTPLPLLAFLLAESSFPKWNSQIV